MNAVSLVDNRKAYVALWAVVLLASAAVLCETRYLPLLDYPNHLARTFIMAHWAERAPFQAAYTLVWRPLPNLAIDLVVPLLARVMSFEAAGRAFYLLALALFGLGCHLVASAWHGRGSWLGPIAAFFFFNTGMLYGFANYTFGVSCFLCALGLWLRFFDAPTITRAIGCLLLAFVCYFAHLSALLMLCLAAAVYGLGELERVGMRGLISRGLPLAPAALFYFVAHVPHESAVIGWDGPMGKLRGIGWLAGYARTPEMLLLALLGLAGVIALVVSTRVRAPRGALFIVALFVVMFFVFPVQIGDTWAADRRFVVPAAILLVLAIELELSPRLGQLLLCCATLLVLAHAAYIGKLWRPMSARIDHELSLLRILPEGARVYPIVFWDPADKTQLCDHFVPHYETIERGFYVPTLFSHGAQQPIALRHTHPLIEEPARDESPASQDWRYAFGYDYIWTYRVPEAWQLYLLSHCTRVLSEDDAAIYRSCRSSR